MPVTRRSFTLPAPQFRFGKSTVVHIRGRAYRATSVSSHGHSLVAVSGGDRLFVSHHVVSELLDMGDMTVSVSLAAGQPSANVEAAQLFDLSYAEMRRLIGR